MNDLRPWLRLIFRHRRRLWLGGLLMFATLATGIGLLALSGWFITATALTGLLVAAGVAATLDVYVPGGGIRFFALARTVSRYFERLYNHDTVLRLLADLRTGFFQKLANTPVHRRRQHRSSDWLNRLTADIEALDNLYLRLLAPAALALLVTLLVALVMAVTAPLLLIALVPVAYLPWVLLRLARQNLALTMTLGEQQQAVRGQLVDALEGHQELAAAHCWHTTTGSLAGAADHLDALTLRAERASADAQALVQIATQLAAFLALLLGLWLWQQHALSGPVALMFAVGLFGITEAWQNLPAAFAQTGRTIGAARRLNRDGGDDRERPAPVPAGDGAIATDTGGVTVQLLGLSGRINGEALFAPLSLELAAGERLAIIGPSGCGKSTVLERIAGLVRDGDGAVVINGQSQPDVTEARWLDMVSYLQQNSWLFDSTVAAHLKTGSPGATEGELWAVLEAVDLADRIAAETDGLHCRLGDQGSRFSGGEQRRLALARALLRPAPLLLLDEPFTGLDQATRRRLVSRIEPWLTGRTCIMAAHDAEALPAVDRTINLNPRRQDSWKPG